MVWPAHLHRKSRQQAGVPGHVAAVLARLVGAAENHVFVGLGRKRIPLHQSPQNQRRQVVRTHGCELAGMAADRSAYHVVDKSLLRQVPRQ